MSEVSSIMMDEVLAKSRTWTVMQGDCREILKKLPDDSVDAVCTDPPAGIEFMGKAWDSFEERAPNPSGPQTEAWHDNGGKNPYARSATPRYQGKTKQSLLPFQDFIAEVFTEVYRVMKPGAHALVWALPRTSHHTMMGLERAGFDVRDVITHHFGQGFPKSMDISKALDKAARGVPQGSADPDSPNHGRYKTQAKVGKRSAVDKGQHFGAGASQWMAEGGYVPPTRPVVGRYQPPGGKPWNLKQATDPSVDAAPGTFTASGRRTLDITAPITEEAKKWNGWGTALKPSTEFWILCRKPISENSVAANILKHGTGGINIDDTRIGTSDAVMIHSRSAEAGKSRGIYGDHKELETHQTEGQKIGRFPAHLVLSHAPGCVQKGMKKVRGIPGGKSSGENAFGQESGWNKHNNRPTKIERSEWETVEDWTCAPGCPVAEMDAQSGDLQSGMMEAGQQRQDSKGLGGYHGNFPDTATSAGTYGDTGGASRFFKTFGPRPDSPFGYFPKADRAEREAGLESLKKNKNHIRGPMAGRGQPGLKCRVCGKWKASGNPCQCAKPDWEQVAFERPDIANVHPTVKSVDLMSWLCKMVTPPEGVVLDPFAGSGSTGIAALKHGFRFIGIEQNEEYVRIAKLRIEGDSPLFNLA